MRWNYVSTIMIGDLADYYWKWLVIIMHADYRWRLKIRIDLRWNLIDCDQEWLWSLIMMIESLRWLVNCDYAWRLMDDDWLRSSLMITDNDWWQHNLSLIMMIIIDDLHNYCNFDNYHDLLVIIWWWSWFVIMTYANWFTLIFTDCSS